MPFTFASHQGFVLPLKLAAPRWMDGTALCIGSMAPDLVYVALGTPWYVDAHSPWPQFWLCLPLTVALTWLIKRHVAGGLGPHLPEAGSFHLPDFQRLASWPGLGGTCGLTVVGSALLGTFSHIIIDSFTHPWGWMVQRVDLLGRPLVDLPPTLTGRTIFVHDVLQVAGTVVGAAVAIGCLHAIGRNRLLCQWYPAPTPARRPTPGSRRRLRWWSAAGVMLGLTTAAATTHTGGVAASIMRFAVFTMAGIAAGGAAAQRAMTPSDPPAVD